MQRGIAVSNIHANKNKARAGLEVADHVATMHDEKTYRGMTARMFRSSLIEPLPNDFTIYMPQNL